MHSKPWPTIREVTWWCPGSLAGGIMFPVVTALAVAVGVTAGWITAINLLDLSTLEFVEGPAALLPLERHLVRPDQIGEFRRIAVTLAGSLMGLATRGGAEGVGRNTTRAVVLGCEAILVLDAFWALVLL